MKKRKLPRKILSGSKNVSFDELVSLINSFGFRLSRTAGSHYIFVHHDVNELINIQNFKGDAKPYQVKQFLDLVEKYNLQMKEEE